jgi:4-hydroxy-tetrahydrodipicolinate synthase
MAKTNLISAICTPLTPDESLHHEGLEAHLDEQWQSGIAGALVGGTMGLMPLLADETYRDLVRQATRLTNGRGEVLVGVGDTSFARTLRRIEMAEEFDIDGVVIVTPYLWKYTQAELVDYYRALADR